jgi:hypothetical protein
VAREGGDYKLKIKNLGERFWAKISDKKGIGNSLDKK